MVTQHHCKVTKYVIKNIIKNNKKTYLIIVISKVGAIRNWLPYVIILLCSKMFRFGKKKKEMSKGLSQRNLKLWNLWYITFLTTVLALMLLFKAIFGGSVYLLADKIIDNIQ